MRPARLAGEERFGQLGDASDDNFARAADDAVNDALIAAVPSPGLAFEGHFDGGHVFQRDAHLGQTEYVELFFVVAGRVEQAVVTPAAAGAAATGAAAGAAETTLTTGAASPNFLTETFKPSVSMLTSANGDLAI